MPASPWEFLRLSEYVSKGSSSTSLDRGCRSGDAAYLFYTATAHSYATHVRIDTKAEAASSERPGIQSSES